MKRTEISIQISTAMATRLSSLLALVLIAVAECYHVVSAPLPCVRVPARATPAPVMMAKKQAAGKKVQVVLSQTIKGIGNKGELVSVAPAYAENVVVRGGLGVIASPEILADIAANAAKDAAAAKAAKDAAINDDKKLDAVFGKQGCLIKKSVGRDGAIFGSITAAEVADAIKERAGVVVDKKDIEPPTMKGVGTGMAEVKLHKEVTHKLKIVVAPATL